LEQANAQLRKADELKSDFVANVSHELRTPLTVIRGSVDNMIDGITGEFNERQQLYVSRLKVHADRLALLIDDLLDLSRIEAGHLEIEKVRASITSIAVDVVEHLKPLAVEEKIDLVFVVEERDIEAFVDPHRIYQIVLNLVNNAIKFTPVEGQVRVEVGVEGERVFVAVEDTGVGIPAEELEKIFEKFHQVGEAMQSYRGTGIGLSIASRLVEMHGGQIVVESEEGRGSRFVLFLPKEI
jgi:signal transduction histidine kinase